MGNYQAMWRTALLAGLALPASKAVGQYTGTSHPEDVPVTTNDAGIRQPVVYLTAAPTVKPGVAIAAPELNPRPVATAPAGWAETEVRPTPTSMIEAPAATQMTQAANVDGGIVTRVDGPPNQLPEGTLIKTRLLDHISTRTTREGAEWKAELTEPLMRDGRVLLPAGAMIHGRVTEIHGGKRISGEASIHLQAVSVTLPDGMSMGIHAQVIDTNLYRSTKVDEEGTILRRGNHKQQAGVLALTAGSGAAAGAMVGGVPGAVVGAGIGAGVSGVLWLKQDRQTELPRETQVTFELTRPLAVGVE